MPIVKASDPNSRSSPDVAVSLLGCILADAEPQTITAHLSPLLVQSSFLVKN